MLSILLSRAGLVIVCLYVCFLHNALLLFEIYKLNNNITQIWFKNNMLLLAFLVIKLILAIIIKNDDIKCAILTK